MIKKHLITCSVILVLFVVIKLFVYSVPDKKPLENSNFIFEILSEKRSTPSSLNFAEEELPVHNAKVNFKIKQSIRKNDVLINNDGLQKKAEQWFPVIEPLLRMYGIPEDFKYIPLLESGFNPRARSPRGALGVWQFMPGTARAYGLKVSKKYDERLNIRKSTIAACKYLNELYHKFNSWTLAAAAYNGGSPRVYHAINQRNKGNYYYMHLNHETASYVYKLVAMKEVLNKDDEEPAANNEMWAKVGTSPLFTFN